MSHNRTIAVECDGKNCHDLLRDEFRDAAIIGASEIDTIYRFPGSLLHYQADSCLYLFECIKAFVVSTIADRWTERRYLAHPKLVSGIYGKHNGWGELLES